MYRLGKLVDEIGAERLLQIANAFRERVLQARAQWSYFVHIAGDNAGKELPGEVMKCPSCQGPSRQSETGVWWCAYDHGHSDEQVRRANGQD